MNKVRLIKGSLFCYVLGWVSLIPIFGLIAGFIAIVEAKSLREVKEWNPARNYLIAAVWLSLLGIFISGVIGLLGTVYLLFLIGKGKISLDMLFV